MTESSKLNSLKKKFLISHLKCITVGDHLQEGPSQSVSIYGLGEGFNLTVSLPD